MLSLPAITALHGTVLRSSESVNARTVLQHCGRLRCLVIDRTLYSDNKYRNLYQMIIMLSSSLDHDSPLLKVGSLKPLIVHG